MATTAFVCIDGMRSLSVLAGICLFPALTFQGGLLHDGFLSARRFYSRYELEHLPRIAAPGSAVEVISAFPMHRLIVRFDRAP